LIGMATGKFITIVELSERIGLSMKLSVGLYPMGWC